MDELYSLIFNSGLDEKTEAEIWAAVLADRERIKSAPQVTEEER